MHRGVGFPLGDAVDPGPGDEATAPGGEKTPCSPQNVREKETGSPANGAGGGGLGLGEWAWPPGPTCPSADTRGGEAWGRRFVIATAL